MRRSTTSRCACTVVAEWCGIISAYLEPLGTFPLGAVTLCSSRVDRRWECLGDHGEQSLAIPEPSPLYVSRARSSIGVNQSQEANRPARIIVESSGSICEPEPCAHVADPEGSMVLIVIYLQLRIRRALVSVWLKFITVNDRCAKKNAHILKPSTACNVFFRCCGRAPAAKYNALTFERGTTCRIA